MSCVQNTLAVLDEITGQILIALLSDNQVIHASPTQHFDHVLFGMSLIEVDGLPFTSLINILKGWAHDYRVYFSDSNERLNGQDLSFVHTLSVAVGKRKGIRYWPNASMLPVFDAMFKQLHKTDFVNKPVELIKTLDTVSNYHDQYIINKKQMESTMKEIDKVYLQSSSEVNPNVFNVKAGGSVLPTRIYDATRRDENIKAEKYSRVSGIVNDGYVHSGPEEKEDSVYETEYGDQDEVGSISSSVSTSVSQVSIKSTSDILELMDKTSESMNQLDLNEAEVNAVLQKLNSITKQLNIKKKKQFEDSTSVETSSESSKNSSNSYEIKPKQLTFGSSDDELANENVFQ